MIKRYVRSRDDLAIAISLATALGIVLSAIVGVWLWSAVAAERGVAIP
ncbi:MAG: hypothetical protein AB7P24_01305 [Nitrospira sp.]